MGACDFVTSSYGKDVETAYSMAVEQALIYAGHQEGYNGTISTTVGCRLKEYKISGPMTDKAIENAIDAILEMTKKRECMYIELRGEALKKEKERLYKKGAKGIRVFLFIGWAAE